MLNPIQQRIADGMSPLAAVFTDHTCGEACWEAREPECRCACAGRNHGCMRVEGSVQPERTAKIDGLRYVLKATCVTGTRTADRFEDSAKRAHDALYDEAMRLNLLYGGRVYKGKPDWRSWDTNVKGAPARIRNASKSQFTNWPELASYRETIATIRAAGGFCPNDIFEAWPQLLWVREDIAQKEETIAA